MNFIIQKRLVSSDSYNSFRISLKALKAYFLYPNFVALSIQPSFTKTKNGGKSKQQQILVVENFKFREVLENL